jgi:mRNA-degrading endonuclease RelE of RelBE toxin-antitoxin system
MAWKITLTKSALSDLAWFGKKIGPAVLEAATELLEADPVTETRNLKTLRPNPAAQRELRLLGKYRILFNVDPKKQIVTILAAGEKRGNKLMIQGREYTAHHEDHTAE